MSLLSSKALFNVVTSGAMVLLSECWESRLSRKTFPFAVSRELNPMTYL